MLTLKGHSNGVVSVVFFPGIERVITGSADCTARVWDARTGGQLYEIGNTGFNGCYASVSPDGSRILTTNHPYVKLWDARTGDELVTLKGHAYWPHCSAFSPDGSRLATGFETADDRRFTRWLLPGDTSTHSRTPCP